MKTEDAQKIAEETRKTYDDVAGEFSASRAKFWDELAFLAKHIKPGDRVLDIGCGNGRFLPLVKERGGQYVGVDYSEGLIREAKRLHPDGEFVVGDATKLSFLDSKFDVAYSFATIHHVPSKELRAQFIREAARVVKPGGMFILTAWHLWQPRNFLKLFMSINPLSPLEAGDMLLTFGKNKAPRYLHAFTRRELSLLLIKNGFHVESIETIPRPSGEKNTIVVAKRAP